MKRLFLLLFLLPFLAHAQSGGLAPGKNLKDLKVKPQPATVKPIKTPDVAKVNGPNKEVLQYANTITASDLEAHLEFLASDELEGRETGTRGQKTAAKYLATQFQKMGLKPGNGDSYYQEYELTRTMIEDVTLSFDGKEKLAFGKGFAFYDKGAFAAGQTAPLAFGGYGIESKGYNNLSGLDLKGKAVLVLAGEPEKDGKSIIEGSTDDEPAFDTGKKQELLQAAGATAMLVVLPNARFKSLAGNPWLRHMMESPSLRLTHLEKKRIPMAFISEDMANKLLKKSKKSVEEWKNALAANASVPAVAFGKYKFELETEANQEVIIAENVLGFIEGTDKKEEVVVVTAHYDHLGVRDGVVYNGADDDGSGTAALLEIAEAFMKAVEDGKGPRRSILVMPVSGEEKGLLGSRYYTDFPIYSLENTVCNLNVDMIGRIDDHHENGNYIYVIGSNMLSNDLHEANELANKQVTQLELDYRYNTKDDPNRYYYRSDHYNFAKNKVPCIFYFSGVHEDYHKSTDTIEKIDFKKSERVAQLIFATAWEVANRNARLKLNE